MVTDNGWPEEDIQLDEFSGIDCNCHPREHYHDNTGRIHFIPAEDSSMIKRAILKKTKDSPKSKRIKKDHRQVIDNRRKQLDLQRSNYRLPVKRTRTYRDKD